MFNALILIILIIWKVHIPYIAHDDGSMKDLSSAKDRYIGSQVGPGNNAHRAGVSVPKNSERRSAPSPTV